MTTAESPDHFTEHCGFCDRDIISFVQPPTMCEVTVKSNDGTLDATYGDVCLSCAIEVLKTMGSQHA